MSQAASQPVSQAVFQAASSQAATLGDLDVNPASADYTRAIDSLYALGQELAPLPPLPDGTPAPRRKWDLAHMRTLCAALGDPQSKFPSVLIAGTNGKGSTAATLASILSVAGYKTGLYTSPHLVRVNERIQILPPDAVVNSEMTSSSFAKAGGPASPATQPQPTDLSSLAEGGGPASPSAQVPRAPFIAPLPHAMSGNPTIRSTEIPDHHFARLFSLVDDTSAALVASNTLPHSPSFFEVLTALAFLYFAEEKVDIAVLEVGLGGRLDATNIVDPLISVITDIALDHQDYLGDTIAAITREKAGILRPGGILVTLPQHPEANQAIGEAAATLNLTAISAADFIPSQTPSLHPQGGVSPSEGGAVAATIDGPASAAVDRSVILSKGGAVAATAEGSASAAVNRSVILSEGGAPAAAVEGPAFAFPLPRNHYTLTLDHQPLIIDSPLPGHHQQRNLALAIATAITLRNQKGYNIASSAMEAGIRNTQWPGRLEFLTPNLLLDVAHNPAGAWTLRAAIAQLPEAQPRTLIFSCLSDKNLTEISRILFPLFDSSPGMGREQDHILLAPIANPRAARVEDLLAAAHALEIPAHAAPHLEAALAQAKAITPTGGLIIATGSVYLVGAIRDLTLKGLPA